VKRRGIVAAAIAAAVLVLAGSGGSARGQDGKPVVFTVGYTQDIHRSLKHN
jgi:ABC-type sugar transport system substrate-binding protein